MTTMFYGGLYSAIVSLILLLFAISQAIQLVHYIIILRMKKMIHCKILSAICVILIFTSFYSSSRLFLKYSRVIQDIPAIFTLRNPFGFAVGPLFLAISLSIKGDVHIMFVWNFIPFVLILMVQVTILVLGVHFSSFEMVVVPFMVLHLLCYKLWTIISLSGIDFAGSNLHRHLTILKIRRLAMYTLTIWMTGSTMLVFSAQLALVFNRPNIAELIDFWGPRSMSMLMLQILPLLLVSHIIEYYRVLLLQSQQGQEKPPKPDSEYSMHDIAEKIRVHLDETLAYLDPDISIHDIANELNLPAYTISNAINRVAECSFPKLIRVYRVKFAAALLKNEEYRNLSINDIAQQSGFRTRSNFYSAFHEEFGMSPHSFKSCPE